MLTQDPEPSGVPMISVMQKREGAIWEDEEFLFPEKGQLWLSREAPVLPVGSLSLTSPPGTRLLGSRMHVPEQPRWEVPLSR